MGSVVISLDAELGWGFHDLDRPLPPRISRRIRTGRQSWMRLIDVFEEHDIPATWAVVSHLLLERCDGRHANHPAPDGWFANDPGGTVTSAPDWFGPDLIAAINESGVDHEIGSHSFSHVEFGRPTTTAEMVDAELRLSVSLSRSAGIDLESFVFPRNNIGFRDQLAEHGFRCYRGPSPRRGLDGTTLQPVGNLTRLLLGRSAPPIVTPEIDEYGLVNIPASLDVFSLEGIGGSAIERVFGDPLPAYVEMGLSNVVEGGGVLHLWFHPNDLVNQSKLERISRICSLIETYRDREGLSVETMANVANRVS